MTFDDYANWQAQINTILGLSSSDWASVSDPVSGIALNSFPCSDVSVVPTLAFTFSSYTYTLSNSNWMDTTIVNSQTYCVPKI